jgi:tripartite tricarboxylate transporter TctB family protein
MPQRTSAGLVEASAALVVAGLAVAGFIAVPHLVAGWAFVIPGTTDGAMAPTFFPRVALAMTATFGILVALTVSMRTDPLPLLAMTRASWLRIGALVLISVAYLASLRLFGFVLSSIALMLVLPLLVGYRKPVPLVATALLLPPAVSLVFWYGLKVALPSGHVLDHIAWFR